MKLRCHTVNLVSNMKPTNVVVYMCIICVFIKYVFVTAFVCHLIRSRRGTAPSSMLLKLLLK